MILIVGLGNPGREYENTRHNLGFFFVDKLQKGWNFPAFELNKKLSSEVSKGKLEIGNWKLEILLVKPQTFMNLSGEAVKKILDFYKLASDDLIVLHDDIDIACGKYKVASDSSSAGHNGVQNIIDRLGTQKFRRVRIGIGQKDAEDNPACRLDAHDFVLGKISPEEAEKIAAIEKKIVQEIINLSRE